MKIIAPGKIILSGEHAIVYGCPAIAVAVSKHTHIHIAHNDTGIVCLNLPDINFTCQDTVANLRYLHHHLDNTFARRMDNNVQNTSPLLSAPGEMYLYGIAHFLTHYGIDQASLTITLSSKIPLGSGMGSSASTLSALYLGLHEYFSIPFDKHTLALQVAHAERLQHACISRIDPNVTVHGGFIQFNNNDINHLGASINSHWRLIYTGIPAASTGECVANVRQHFANSSVWSEFKAVTHRFEEALLLQSHQELYQCIHDNQELLYKIGVVPEKIQGFIKKLHQDCGVSSKISGAGSIRGNNAGLLLAYLRDIDDEKKVTLLCQQHGYAHYMLDIDHHGVRRCD